MVFSPLGMQMNKVFQNGCVPKAWVVGIHCIATCATLDVAKALECCGIIHFFQELTKHSSLQQTIQTFSVSAPSLSKQTHFPLLRTYQNPKWTIPLRCCWSIFAVSLYFPLLFHLLSFPKVINKTYGLTAVLDHDMQVQSCKNVTSHDWQ